MEWKRLLSGKRVRDLFAGPASRKSPVDARNEFERDYGRVVFSTPVRRLQDKAQVFPLEAHDAVRTRLTHSLEVSSVARTLAEQTASWLVDRRELPGGASDARNISTIAATCGLIHDLGNPPFGHAGELWIRDWFQQRFDRDDRLQKALGLPTTEHSQEVQDLRRFEGNAQTIRIVGKLQVLADFHGLNLTCATMSASCKYTAASHEIDSSVHARSRPGYFRSEDDLIRQIRTETGTEQSRHPITFLVEAADDIVYLTVDLEDGIKKRLYDWQFLEKHLREFAGREGASTLDRITEAAHQMVHAGPLDGQERDEAMAVGFRTFAIAECVAAALDVFKEKYAAIMDGSYHGELTRDESFSARWLLGACKQFGRQFVYVSSETLRLEVMGRKVIHDLMDLFWEGARIGGPDTRPKDFAGRLYVLTSVNYRRVFERALREGNLPETYCRLQLVTDQVCGMTDSFAASLHRELMNA